MPKYSTAFGMDVHLRSTTVCALDADTGEAVTRRFPGNPWGEIAGWMDGFPGPSLAAYESGYLGFAPQRELAGLGVECVVAAVSKIPRSAADSAPRTTGTTPPGWPRRYSPTTSPPYVPSPEVEGIRDLAAPTTGRPRAWRPPSSGCSPSSQSGVRLRRHHARRQPEEVLDLRLPEVARQGQAGGRWRGSDARRPEERGRGRGGGPGGPALRVQGRRGCQPDRRGGAALQSIKAAPSRWPQPSRPRSATSRGSVPEGRSRPISASRRVRGRVATPCGSEASAVRATRS